MGMGLGAEASSPPPLLPTGPSTCYHIFMSLASYHPRMQH